MARRKKNLQLYRKAERRMEGRGGAATGGQLGASKFLSPGSGDRAFCITEAHPFRHKLIFLF